MQKIDANCKFMLLLISKGFMKNILCCMLALFFTVYLNGMEESFSSNKVNWSIILPGLNGSGGYSYKKNSIVPYQSKKFSCDVLNSWKIDLGQGNCEKHFLAQIKEEDNFNALKKSCSISLHGVSQGTATLIRAFSHLPEEIKSKVKCLTLESVLADGNSAIIHTTNNQISSKLLYIPFSRFWMPWIGKCFFLTYNPLAQQTLYYAKLLPKDLPIIIMHAKNDPQLSINDARKLYCALYESRKKQKEKNIYLFEVEGGVHLDILDAEKGSVKKLKIKAIQQIYKNHQLPYNTSILKENDASIKLDEFQPSPTKVKERIKQANKQYRIHNIIDSVTAIAGIVVCSLFKMKAKIKHSVF